MIKRHACMMATTPLFLYALGGRCVQGFRPIRYSLSRISSLSQNKFHRALSSQNQFVFDKTTLHSLERNIDEELKEKKLGKKAARRKSKLQEKQRNLRLKEIFENGGQHEGDSDGNFVIPQLYSVKVSVCKELREELRMNGREKRGRMFIELGSPGSCSLKGLKMELHSFFRSLRKSTYILSAALPEVADDGSIMAPVDEDGFNIYPGLLNYWGLETDDDVVTSFEKALSHTGTYPLMKRPSILINVKKDPNAPLPELTPNYLEGMEDPTVTESMTMLSFYAFPPPVKGMSEGIEDPEDFALLLRKLWKPFSVLGRVYIAGEGVNAQMAVPTNVLSTFMECCNSIPQLGVHMENGVNIDPIALTMEEFNKAGSEGDELSPPFKNLHIRVRNQVVADGLDKSLDWQKAGYDMPPLEWHEKVKSLAESSLDDPSRPILLDCRNTYETEVGRFVEAEPLQTENFRDSWDVLKDRLKDTPKDAPIMTYCTGGIRCVKVGAYLTQELGFKNVSRLAGGIISYDRTVNEKLNEKPLFEGVNYVFDGRVGRKITDDKIGTCITCGAKTSMLSNCQNSACHKRMVQCEKCSPVYLGTCSDACKQRVVNSSVASKREFSSSSKVFDNVDDYSVAHSSTPPAFYEQIELNTKKFLNAGAHMVSGPAQGRLLTSIASMTRSGRILEIGTFTGYATCCFLEGAAYAADAVGFEGIGNSECGPFVMSLERDQRAIDVAAIHLNVMSTKGIGKEAAAKAEKHRALNNFEEKIDLLWAQCDNAGRDKFNVMYHEKVGCELLKVDDALATVELIAAGKGQEIAPFDLVFIDADKTRLLDYVEACLSSDNLLRKGGIILVDNVLWKGGVVNIASYDINESIDSQHIELSDAEAKRSRRARKLATVMHSFNEAIVKDERVEVVMLPLRDGLSVIRKR